MKQFSAIPALAFLALSLAGPASAQSASKVPVRQLLGGEFHPSAAFPNAPVYTASRPVRPVAQSRTLAPWAAVASMGVARGQQGSAVIGNKIYSWAGINESNGALNSLEIYDIATNTWTSGASLPTGARGVSAAAGADGMLYSVGGYNSTFAGETYRYNPATNVWTRLASVPNAAWLATGSATSDGRIFVIGGQYAVGSSFTSAGTATQIYTPSTNTWSLGAPMPVGRHGGAAVVDASGLIHVIGGFDGSVDLTSHQVYNPTTNTWATLAPLPSAVSTPGAAFGADGKIYLIGGKSGGSNNSGPFYSTVYVYDQASNTWSAGTSLPLAVGENRAVAAGSFVYNLGGANGTYQAGVNRMAAGATAAAYTWTGATSTDWNTGSNWSGGVVPTSIDDATIPSGLTRYPLVSTTTATAHNVANNSGSTLTVADGATLTLTGNLVNNGTFSAVNNATIALTGATVQSIGGAAVTQVRNLNVGSAGASLTGQVEIQRLLTLTGNLATNSQRFLILSNTIGSGMVVNNGGVVNGATVVQRYIDVATNSGFGYRHFAPAVSGATLANLAIFPSLVGAQAAGPLQVNTSYNTSPTPNQVSPFPTVLGYDQSRVGTVTSTYGPFDQGWFSPTAAQPLAPGQGLTINEPAGNFLELTGPTLNTGPFSRTGLTRGADGEAGWHLLGNPYPAPLDWALLSRTNVDDAAYVYRSTGQYTGGFVSYVAGVGPARVQPMGQAFFVRVSAAGASGTVGFSDAARLTAYATSTFSRNAAETRPLLQLQVQRLGQSGAASQDDFYVYEQAGASTGFDARYDALKVQLNSGDQPTLYQQAGTERVAIQGLPAGNVAQALPLGVNAPVAGTYQFRPEQLLNFAASEGVWLEDKQAGIWHNLRQGAYTAQLSQGLSTQRFVLHLHTASVLSSATATAWAGELQLYPNPVTKELVSVVASGVTGTTAELVLVNSVGQRVWQQTAAVAAKELRAAVPVAGLARGVYTLQMHSATGVLTRKLVLQ